jgi:hypothetical protein
MHMICIPGYMRNWIIMVGVINELPWFVYRVQEVHHWICWHCEATDLTHIGKVGFPVVPTSRKIAAYSTHPRIRCQSNLSPKPDCLEMWK